MTCPVCGADTKVIDSRPIEDGTRRRRQCLECDHRFTTVEIDVDYYDAMRPIDNEAVHKALVSGCAELTNRLYRALHIEGRNVGNG